jgi:hypothetical protein
MEISGMNQIVFGWVVTRQHPASFYRTGQAMINVSAAPDSIPCFLSNIQMLKVAPETKMLPDFTHP